MDIYYSYFAKTQFSEECTQKLTKVCVGIEKVNIQKTSFWPF